MRFYRVTLTYVKGLRDMLGGSYQITVFAPWIRTAMAYRELTVDDVATRLTPRELLSDVKVEELEIICRLVNNLVAKARLEI